MLFKSRNDINVYDSTFMFSLSHNKPRVAVNVNNLWLFYILHKSRVERVKGNIDLILISRWVYLQGSPGQWPPKTPCPAGQAHIVLEVHWVLMFGCRRNMRKSNGTGWWSSISWGSTAEMVMFDRVRLTARWRRWIETLNFNRQLTQLTCDWRRRA